MWHGVCYLLSSFFMVSPPKCDRVVPGHTFFITKNILDTTYTDLHGFYLLIYFFYSNEVKCPPISARFKYSNDHFSFFLIGLPRIMLNVKPKSETADGRKRCIKISVKLSNRTDDLTNPSIFPKVLTA